jgi:hypothetical protein
MARTAYTFLADSLLFDSDLISDAFASVPRQDLEKELLRYREHIFSSQAELEAELMPPDSGLSIYFDSSARSQPTIDLLKQCLLYYDQVILDDPLFVNTAPRHAAGDAAGQVLGYTRSTVNPQRVASAAAVMKTLTPLVAGGLLKFAPISYRSEPSEALPIRYSQNLFAEGLPPKAAELLRGAARVHALKRGDEGWFYRDGDPLQPSRGICVEFDGLDFSSGGLPFIYHLFVSRVVSMDETTGRVQLEMTVPDEPPDPEQFSLWITQSVNQSAQRVLSELALDCATALQYQSMLCTHSPLIAHLLRPDPGVPSPVEAELAQIALQLDVPVLANASVATLMNVRQNNGQAFANFRTALSRGMRSLRSISDAADRARGIQDLAHEFASCQVQEVDAAIKRVKGELAIEGIAAIASLAAVIPTSAGSAGFFGLLGSVFSSGLTLKKYVSEIKGHPGYFLWQLKRAATAQPENSVAERPNSRPPRTTQLSGYSPRSLTAIGEQTDD